MPDDKHTGRAVWLASYPKSGNTWLCLLLEAYRCNGALDINDVRVCISDGAATVTQGVSPMPLDRLNLRYEALLRPAALMNLFCRHNTPFWCKTHWANLQLDGLPPFIPKEFTEKAIYVLRDPRSVLTSVASFWSFPFDKACDAMASKEFVIGGNKVLSRCMISSWSNHVASWTGEQGFPVHIVRYEDMLENPVKELTEVLEFLDQEVDEDRVQRATEVTEMSRLQKLEKEEGFREHSGYSECFFRQGGTRWKDDLGQTYIKRIESDHGKIMELLGYEI